MKVVKLVNVSKRVLGEWSAQQVERHPDNYSLDANEDEILVPEDEWELEERDTDYGVYRLIVFTKAGVEFKMPMRYNAEPKEGLQMYAKKYVAIDGFTAPNGKVIAPGTVKWFMNMG